MSALGGGRAAHQPMDSIPQPWAEVCEGKLQKGLGVGESLGCRAGLSPRDDPLPTDPGTAQQTVLRSPPAPWRELCSATEPHFSPLETPSAPQHTPLQSRGGDAGSCMGGSSGARVGRAASSPAHVPLLQSGLINFTCLGGEMDLG